MFKNISGSGAGLTLPVDNLRKMVRRLENWPRSCFVLTNLKAMPTALMSNECVVPRFLNWAGFSVVVIFLILGLIVDKLAGIGFHLLLAVSIVSILICGSTGISSFLASVRRYWPLHAAMCMFFVSVAINKALIGGGSVKDFNFALRFSAFVFFLWLFLQFDRRQFRILGLVFAVAALAIMVKTYVITDGGVQRGYQNFMPILAFTEIGAILGGLAVLSAKWDGQATFGATMLVRSIKVAACLAGFYSIYLYQSRGALLAVPLLVIMISFGMMPSVKAGKKALLAVLMLSIVASGYLATESVRQRIAQAQSDVSALRKGEGLETPLGVRYQLWRGSMQIFRENMLVGVGGNGYTNALEDLVKRKELTPDAATFPHSHNEFLFTAVIFGILGILTLLAMYFVPAGFFFRHIRRGPAPKRAAATMGILLCFCYLLDGLVDVMFIWRECGIFFTIVLALLVAAVSRFDAEQDSSNLRPGV